MLHVLKQELRQIISLRRTIIMNDHSPKHTPFYLGKQAVQLETTWNFSMSSGADPIREDSNFKSCLITRYGGSVR